MKTLLREPLVHFLAAGLALVGARALVATEDAAPPIVIDDALVAGLRQAYGGLDQPDDTLVEDWLRNELLYRQARALGLDRGDAIVRRRLVQKAEALLSAQFEAPTDTQLEEYRDAHAGQFRTPETVDFEHRFFSRDRLEDAEGAARQWLEADPAERAGLATSAFLYGEQEIGRSGRTLNGRFGEGFFAKLGDAPVGSWFGPVESRYGFHVIKLAARHEGALPQLAQIRPAVEAAWIRDAREEALQRAVEELRGQAVVQDLR